MLSNLNVVDLQEKYTGLEVLAHVVSRFFGQIAGVHGPGTAMQVFACLAKGAHTEVKKIVNPALDILLPAWVTGPEPQVSAAGPVLVMPSHWTGAFLLPSANSV